VADHETMLLRVRSVVSDDSDPAPHDATNAASADIAVIRTSLECFIHLP
jgi:hypothetical protein